jgi:hypothetical protein
MEGRADQQTEAVRRDHEEANRRNRVRPLSSSFFPMVVDGIGLWPLRAVFDEPLSDDP